MLTKLKPRMTRRQWEILQGTPFAHLMEVNPILQERVVLDALMQIYDGRIQCFKIGESTFTFRPDDVALIMGCEGDIVSFKHEKEHSIFEQTYLHKMHSLH